MSSFKRELFEVRFQQAFVGLKRLSPNRVVPLKWTVFEDVRLWPNDPSIEQIRKEAQLTIDANPSVWSEHPIENDNPISKKRLSALEQTQLDEESAIRKRLPNLRKSLMDTITRVRLIHYLGKEVYNNLPD